MNILVSLHVGAQTLSHLRRTAFSYGVSKSELMRVFLDFGVKLTNKLGPTNLESVKNQLEEFIDSL